MVIKIYFNSLRLFLKVFRVVWMSSGQPIYDCYPIYIYMRQPIYDCSSKLRLLVINSCYQIFPMKYYFILRICNIWGRIKREFTTFLNCLCTLLLNFSSALSLLMKKLFMFVKARLVRIVEVSVYTLFIYLSHLLHRTWFPYLLS